MKLVEGMPDKNPSALPKRKKLSKLMFWQAMKLALITHTISGYTNEQKEAVIL